jgi:hypothetical protein
MARIRSVHPGFFKDEELVSCSLAARLFFIGLCTEADDRGVFEWKIFKLKIEIFPVDNVDIPALLSELQGVNAIRTYEVAGKKYGAVRNFRKFQRPKKPNFIHPIPPNLLPYVGLGDDSSPPVPHQNGTGEECSPQMEDGGGRREGEDEESVCEDAQARAFAEFAALYPIGKLGVEADAREAFEEAVASGAHADMLVAALKRSVEAWRREKTASRFVPDADTWLRKGRWKIFAAPKAVMPRGAAPPDVRAEVVAEMGGGEVGEAFAASYLDPAGWVGHDGENVTSMWIFAATNTAMQKLLPLKCLIDRGISISLRERSA